MITEDYVSFETAKLLKEKGFDEACYAYWHENEHRLIISQSMHAIQNVTNPCFFGNAAPTLQMAMKWLREKQLFHISIYIVSGGSWVYDIWDISSPYDGLIVLEYSEKGFKSYEEACEAAIKYCLENLI